MTTFPARLTPFANRVRTRSSRRRRCRGSFLVESTIAIAMASILLAGMSMIVLVITRQARSSKEQLVAMNEVANEMEVWMARPWSTLIAVKPQVDIPNEKQSDEFRQSFPNHVMRVEVLLVKDNERCRHLRISLRSNVDEANNDRLYQLSAWRYQPESTPTSEGPKP